MAVKRLQNRVSQSRMALPVISVYSILLWVLGGMFNEGLWANITCFVVSTYLMVELNNANSLIRIYSRMVSCSYLVILSASCFLFQSMQGAIVQLCAVAFYISLFHSYQDKYASNWVFYAFLCFGLASLAFVQVLFLTPVLWIVMIFNLRSMSMRTFCASLLGIMTPYWLIGAYCIYDRQMELFIKHFVSIADFQPLGNYSSITEHQWVTLVIILILALTGIVHYLRTSYNDKIRVRMLFQTFIILDIFSVIFLFLQPQHYDVLLRLIIINTSPLLAHYVVLTKTWITNVSFVLITIALLLLTVYNLWVPSLVLL